MMIWANSNTATTSVVKKKKSSNSAKSTSYLLSYLTVVMKLCFCITDQYECKTVWTTGNSRSLSVTALLNHFRYASHFFLPALLNLNERQTVNERRFLTFLFMSDTHVSKEISASRPNSSCSITFLSPLLVYHLFLNTCWMLKTAGDLMIF